MSTGNEGSLEAEGWQRMATASEPRLSEMVEIYKSLQYEVRLEPVILKNGEGCSQCMDTDLERYRTIYVKQLDNR